MSFVTALDQIITVVASVSGIRAAYDDPPSKWGKGVYAVVYSTIGEADQGPPEQMRTLDDVVVGVLVPMRDIAKDTQLMLPFRDSVPNALFAARKAGTFTALDTFGAITHTLGPVTWGDVTLFGYLFTIRSVKIRSAIA